jgi:hypothetical protein
MGKGSGRAAAGRRGSARCKTAARSVWDEAGLLKAFVEEAPDLTLAEKKLIVEQALILFSDNYVHLPLKRARYSVDPVQRLKLLLQTLEQASAEDPRRLPPSARNDVGFHRELTDIFTSVRDLHTDYLLPAPYNQATAFLPFLVETHWDESRENRKYIVSRLSKGFQGGSFKPGVELTHWNGTPIERAVWNNAELFAGSNPEARHARGLQGLTVRPLKTDPPPEEDWVVVRYLVGRTARTKEFNWRVCLSTKDGGGGDAGTDAGDRALDLSQDIIRGIHRELFGPPETDREDQLPASPYPDLETELDSAFSARRVSTPSGEFGYIRIWSFKPPGGSTEAFVNEFIRLLAELLPNEGLIIDVRANGGGSVNCAERLLQTLTHRTIEPEPFQFINSSRNLAICQRDKVPEVKQPLEPWVASMAQSLQTGAVYSAGHPITYPAKCNEIGQKYFGPVVLITDALSYSATDVFAAGFFDNKIGVVLGVDAYTGAGGANVWTHTQLLGGLPGAGYEELPKEAGMRISIRRALRVGDVAGAPLEDFGVRPHERYFMTRDDVLCRNVDLIKRAGELLKGSGRPSRTFELKEESRSREGARLAAHVTRMTRLDVYVGPHSIGPVFPDQEGKATFEVSGTDAPDAFVEIRGFEGPEMVARVRWVAPRE